MKALLEDGYDFAYIHVEAPDEMGHQGSVERKIKAIENIDTRIISRVMQRMDASGEDYRVIVLPDHPTPIRTRTHSSEPIPYMLYDSTKQLNKDWFYNEKAAKASGNFVENGYELVNQLFA